MEMHGNKQEHNEIHVNEKECIGTNGYAKESMKKHG